jgi:deoxyribodipyrimidine photo-lyase
MTKENLNIVIIRHNQRVLDNAPLYYASQENSKVLAIYSKEIINSKNKFQTQFIYQSLANLEKNLKQFNINLTIVESIDTYLELLSISYKLKIFYEKEVGIDEKKFELILHKYPHKEYFNQTMIEPFSFDHTKSFSHFRKKAEKLAIPKVLSKPNSCETIKIEKNCIFDEMDICFKGGEDDAIKRLDDYENYLHNYLDTRSLVDGLNNSTKFSPYLSQGNISARQIYWYLKDYESRTYESKSTYWIYFELLWRDFFHLVMLQSDNKLFLTKGLKNIKYCYNEFKIEKTNVDIVDASILELTTTGWLSNRNRQILSSFFIKNLGFSWLDVAIFFENYLIDYNVASNYGNCAYQGYVGNDSTYRIFDPIKQSKQYNGKQYVKKWLQKDESYRDNFSSKAILVKENIYKL